MTERVTAATWPPGWREGMRLAWLDRGLDVEVARSFRDWRWTPSAALVAVGPLTPEEIEVLRMQRPPIRVNSEVRDVLRLHRAHVASYSNDWDAAAASVLEGLDRPDEVARRLNPGDDPVLSVLGALHEVDPAPPVDVALVRHCEKGCRCEADRFKEYLGIGPIEQPGPSHVVSMVDDEGTCLQIRTGPYLAARIEGGPWLRLPDLASACWYLHKLAPGDVVEVDGSTAGLRCMVAMAELTPGIENTEIEVNGTTLMWDGSALLPGSDVPDSMVVAESRWEGDHGTPLNTEGVTYLIESGGTYYFGDAEMGWSEQGPFATVAEAEAWFTEQIREADDEGVTDDDHDE